MSSIEHLRAFAKPLGVRLLLENIPNELTAPEKLVELIHTLHYDDIGVCLDLGHAHLGPGVEAAIETLKPLIRSVHVHDNHGMKDEHLWPGEGTIDFQRTMEIVADRSAGSRPWCWRSKATPRAIRNTERSSPERCGQAWERLESLRANQSWRAASARISYRKPASDIHLLALRDRSHTEVHVKEYDKGLVEARQ